MARLCSTLAGTGGPDTGYIERLLDEGAHYFLSRPRRFGKSLFLDTLKELFEGNEALFEGLHIHPGHDWSVQHPVVRLDFAGAHFGEPGSLHANVSAQLDGIEVQEGVRPRYDTAPERFAYLIRSLRERRGQDVVVLVDGYDKPILDAMKQRQVARANRDYLRGLYGVIKASDAHVRFTFLTGVSKFAKVSIFSDLNNLNDITLDPVYSSICGYTERDLETVFASELAGLDRERVREWYNGYGWRGPEKVYNPFDVLLLQPSPRQGLRHLLEQLFQTGQFALTLHFPPHRGMRTGEESRLEYLQFGRTGAAILDRAVLDQTGAIILKDVAAGSSEDIPVELQETYRVFGPIPCGKLQAILRLEPEGIHHLEFQELQGVFKARVDERRGAGPRRTTPKVAFRGVLRFAKSLRVATT